MNIGSGMRADVLCVFCTINNAEEEVLQKKIIIQCQTPRGSTSLYWNYANLKKHLSNHLKHHLKTVSNAESNTESESEATHNKTSPYTCDQDDSSEMTESAESKTIVQEDEIITIPNNYQTNILYDQLSTQNLKLIEFTMLNNGTKKYMEIEHNGERLKIGLSKIKGNGDCIFASLAAQIHFEKIDTPKHQKLTDNLREKVVDHIKNNFERFKHALRGRIWDQLDDQKFDRSEGSRKMKIKRDDSDEACSILLNGKLSQSGFWGGSESILAISEIYYLNILVFREYSGFFFPCSFNPKYERTIFLAYRGYNDGQGSIQYNHYDSVCDVSCEILYKCAND